MKSVFKYQLQYGITTLDLPAGAKVLRFDMDRMIDEPSIWVLVDRDLKETKPRKFCLFGTGHDIPMDSQMRYIGTCFEGQLVWHLFEEETR